jgi:putative transposase
MAKALCAVSGDRQMPRWTPYDLRRTVATRLAEKLGVGGEQLIKRVWGQGDGSVPFASRSAFFGLSKLSVWWLRLGIGIERIKPGNPQQNGRHERMHLTLKKEATKPPAKNFLQQQGKFDDFIQCFNHDRPHQALNMKYPGELYRPSPRAYTGLSEVEYPFHDRTITVTQCGRICIGRRKINLSGVFAGQNIGITEVSEKIWLVSFMQYDLGFFDHESGRVECAPNPFGAKLLPMCPV